MSRIDLSEYRTVAQLVVLHPQTLTYQRLRWALRHRKANGLARHVRRSPGFRGFLIHEPSLLRWVAGRFA